MTHAPTRVALVAGGGISGPEAYQNLAETFARSLAREKQPVSRDSEEPKPAFDAKVFTDTAAALQFLEPNSGGKRTIAFMSISQHREAAEVAKQHPDLFVVILTGKDPEAGVAHVVYKKWLDGRNLGKFLE
ncbi:MAG: hypothetical protein JO019_03395 [Candidatus Kaiserbacteria bacterium]|nr:hypothetical protein [Candidatus Kaiserbacteria bacterium]